MKIEIQPEGAQNVSTEAKEIATVKPIETQVAEWSATESVLREAVKATEGVTVAANAESPKKGRDAVHDSMMVLANHRVAIEKRRKELKAPILTLGTLVDSEARRLTAIIEPREIEMRKDRDAYDAEQAKVAAAAKAEAERIEAENKAIRAAALQKRVSRVVALGGTPALDWLDVATEEAFAEQIAELESAKAKRDEEVRIAAEAKAEADRLEADRIEAERKAREAEAEAKRIADAAEAAERKRVQDIEDARRAAEQSEIDKARAELEAERVKLAKAKEEADAAEAARIQRIKREEEEKIEAQRLAEIEAERARCEVERKIEEEREELARIARAQAEKPDREKLAQWAALAMGAIPEIPSTESESLYERAEALRCDVKNLLNVFAHEMAVA